jgi:hypothetical protein
MCSQTQFRIIQACAVSTLMVVPFLSPAETRPSGLRTQNFDSDPGWESFRSHLKPDPTRITRQDFGPRRGDHFAKTGSEIGGWVQRSATPARFAKSIPAKTLHDRLSASGKFAVTKSLGNSGMLFGWFNQTSRGWRTPNSLVFRIDGEKNTFRVFFEYGTQHWLTGGGGCFEGEHYQTTPTPPFPADASVHTWNLDYNPDGDGLITFTLDGKKYERAFATGHKEDGATFDQFGIFNQQSSGNGLEVYFSDLVIDGKPETAFDSWQGKGNKAEFPERVVRPFHDFGFSQTGHAASKPGELGGIIWRDEKPACYGDKVGPLSLHDELFVSGRFVFAAAGSDSAAYIGWYDSNSKTNQPYSRGKDSAKNFLGICLEGPSRIGHYFRPAYRDAAGDGRTRETGPIIRPDGKPHDFSLHYLPSTDGAGEIRMTLDKESVTLTVLRTHIENGSTFDRFGLFNVQEGGIYVEIYLDDLQYTAKK